jgi:hypothetical protein
MTLIYLIAYFSPNPTCILCLCCLTSALSLQCFCIVHCLSIVFSASLDEWHCFIPFFPSYSHHFVFPFFSFLSGIKLFFHVCLMWFQLLLTKIIMVLSFKTIAHLDFAVESGVTHNNISPTICVFYTICLRGLPLASE